MSEIIFSWCGKRLFRLGILMDERDMADIQTKQNPPIGHSIIAWTEWGTRFTNYKGGTRGRESMRGGLIRQWLGKRIAHAESGIRIPHAP